MTKQQTLTANTKVYMTTMIGIFQEKSSEISTEMRQQDKKPRNQKADIPPLVVDKPQDQFHQLLKHRKDGLAHLYL